LIPLVKARLSKTMTLSEFENGYWYATELKDLGEAIGIPSARKLRKDELERAIINFIKSGTIKSPTNRNLSKN
jgi:SAP domain-containing new25